MDPSANIQPAPGQPRDELAAARRRREHRGGHEHLRCVSSGYLAGGGSCGATVPAEAAALAWERELWVGGAGDRFFQFSWQGELWLGYGLRGGRVRGVYCPEHNAQRTERFVEQRIAHRPLAGEALLSA